jgi:hypothetical protein
MRLEYSDPLSLLGSEDYLCVVAPAVLVFASRPQPQRERERHEPEMWPDVLMLSPIFRLTYRRQPSLEATNYRRFALRRCGVVSSYLMQLIRKPDFFTMF